MVDKADFKAAMCVVVYNASTIDKLLRVATTLVTSMAAGTISAARNQAEDVTQTVMVVTGAVTYGAQYVHGALTIARRSNRIKLQGKEYAT